MWKTINCEQQVICVCFVETSKIMVLRFYSDCLRSLLFFTCEITVILCHVNTNTIIHRA